jgi:benzil reductase ((S)-benzoin forming)
VTKWSIITGAGTGIGRALALELVAQGWRVLAVGRREALLQELAEQTSGAVKALAADVADPSTGARIEQALGEGSLELLVHNAAVLEPSGPLEAISREAFREHVAINLEAPLFLTQALLPRLVPESRVLHISSGAAHRNLPGWGPYCTSKAALYQLYRCLREELAPRRVHVGSARPGVVDTPMQEHIRGLSEERFPDVNMFRQLKAEGQLTSSEDAARFLSWLLLKTDPEYFTEREYDIREPELRPLWSPESGG